MIWITSHDDGNIESYASLTRQNKIEYCERHGYRHLLTQGEHREEPELSPAWCLVATVRQALSESAEGDFIVLTGADSCIVDMDFSLESLLYGATPEYALSVIAPDDETYALLLTSDENGYNTNGMVFRNCHWTRDFVRRWWELRGLYGVIRTNGNEHLWEEQGMLFYLLEKSEFAFAVKWTGRKEDTMMPWRVAVTPVCEISQHVALVPQEILNGYEPEIYGDHYKRPVFFAHYPGKKAEERTYFIKRALGLVPRVPLPRAHWIDEQGNIQPPQ